MSWGTKNNTKDDTDYEKPRQLPPSGYARPEQRAADAAINALNEGARKMAERGQWPPSSMLHEPPPPVVNLTKFEDDMNEDRIADIKEIVSKLTYGEMMALAEQWADSMLTGTIDKDQFKFVLPPTLHAWTTKETT
jgi:hypothetical protein